MPKILVADDSRVQVHLLKTALQERGFEVVVAMDAMQAGMAALRSAPDAIVLDINMPGGSGIEVLKRLRHSTKTQHIPVLVVSGCGDEDVQHVALELGVCAFLPKPVNTDDLCESLSKLLSPTG
jgi:DNA-binding response OmpR family regulator